MKLKQYITEGTFERGEIAIYGDNKGTEVKISKKGSGYYGDTGDFDFDAKNLTELKMKLKKWGYTINIAGKDLKI